MEKLVPEGNFGSFLAPKWSPEPLYKPYAMLCVVHFEYVVLILAKMCENAVFYHSNYMSE